MLLTRLCAIGIHHIASSNNTFELCSRSPSNCPSDVRWEASGDMFSCQSSSVACGAPDNDVIFTVSECCRHVELEAAMQLGLQ